jgi:hypothetical protein
MLYDSCMRNETVGSRPTCSFDLQRLVELCQKHHVPTGLVSYASCDLGAKQWMFANAPDSPLYFTCSREVGRLPCVLTSLSTLWPSPNSVNHAVKTNGSPVPAQMWQR